MLILLDLVLVVILVKFYLKMAGSLSKHTTFVQLVQHLHGTQLPSSTSICRANIDLMEFEIFYLLLPAYIPSRYVRSGEWEKWTASFTLCTAV